MIAAFRRQACRLHGDRRVQPHGRWLYVGFEGPSWVSAMVALANTSPTRLSIAASIAWRSMPATGGQRLAGCGAGR